ncbi:MAG: PAS domain S-box protein [Candidatus Omnitrophica bacterium]|nr:PAS domain S-box protein [Candidatus Omnitrophota bacterium]
MKNKIYSKTIIFIVILIILAVSIAFTGVVIRLEDRRMRRELLVQARMLERAVNIRHILNLSGSEADIDSPDYQRLKEQLALARSANPQCRFTYLMGQRPSGEVFFFVDSEPQDSKDYSPPGQIYTEISPLLLNVFAKEVEAVEGPVSDRWGKWISALVPVVNPENGRLLAVLGMDIDARNWMASVIYKSLPPVFVTLLIFIFLGTSLLFQRRGEQERIRLAVSKIALQHSEESFQHLFENIADGVAIFKAVDEGENFVFVNLNKMGEKISQVKREDIVGRRVTEAFPAVSEIGLLDVLRRVWRTGESEYLPGVLYKDSRIEHWTENYVLKLPSGLVVSIYSNISKRKQYQDEIVSQARFPAEDPNPVLRINRDGTLLYINQSGLRRLTNWNLQIGQLAPSVLRDLVSKALEGGLEQQCDIEHGEQMYSFYVTPIVDSGYANLYGLDVTERQQAKKKISEYAERLGYLTKYANDFIMLLDENFILLEVNERAQDVYGYSYNELIGMHASKLRAPEAKDRFTQQVNLVQATGKAVYDTLHQRKDGTKFPVEVSLRAFKIGEKRFYQAIIRDITESRKIQDDLERKTELLEAQKEASLDGLLVVDEKGQKILINKRLLELWRVPEDIAEDKKDETLLQYVVNEIKNPQQFLDKVNYLYEHKDEKSRDEIEFKNGMIFDRYSSPVIDKNGKYFGRIWTFRDITELKQAEQKLKKDLHELEVFYKASIGREERILELKKQIKELEKKVGQG